ncbi:CMGC/CLK protein kinase [Aspergillus sclerotioniger CBS 115572]|uniref:non-specific serine/threonine protein kinase n=1 Tax=Aspergillus sclerotioniger CBS 115572 TaxID=1450535 RepID=A0A317WKF5_9EURO|nr:CMGC/CLK protein kinase [Aspergillus sclerotioniger CBS 115572]PWY85762.1 CMGC/CLK protein kinase [Aspergillus sclerotioniger CBS 115572]
MVSIPPLHPRQFPVSGFMKLDPSNKIEEEQLPFYVAESYYLVYIGEVFASRYQVVSKLGYGTSSTTWLCRDLQERGYYTLKVCVQGQQPNNEIATSEHLRKCSDHSGKKLVRLVLDSFELVGPHGKHTCLIYQPLGMTFTEFRDLLPERKFPKNLLQRSIQLTLIALAFMHENHVIHTGQSYAYTFLHISSNNLHFGIEDPSVLSQIEEDETKRPIARKVLPDRIIYFSRPMPVSTGLPVLSDLGEARIGGDKQRGDSMPGIYRAPEVVLDMDWDSKVDIWSIGAMAWDLVEDTHLFFAKKDRVLNDDQHLAEMISLMGSPPPEFLKRSEKSERFWTPQGKWKGAVPIPEQTLSMRERQFSGEDNILFLNFLRNIFRWSPDERPTAEELAYDDFLMQPVLESRAQK